MLPGERLSKAHTNKRPRSSGDRAPASGAGGGGSNPPGGTSGKEALTSAYVQVRAFYGGGSLFSLAGARIGDRRLALLGNSAIPLLSLSALSVSSAAAIGLLCGGRWARNLRSPARRVMLVEAVPRESDRNSAFGFLHALDVGGGAEAGLYMLVAVIALLIFQGVSAATGYMHGSRFPEGLAGRFANLSVLGYLISALGSAVLAVGYAADAGRRSGTGPRSN